MKVVENEGYRELQDDSPVSDLSTEAGNTEESSGCGARGVYCIEGLARRKDPILIGAVGPERA